MWAKCTDGFCDYRESMVEDLMTNHLSEGMSVAQLNELLGPPDYRLHNIESRFGYNVFMDYGSDIDPVETKTLEFEIKDSLIISFKLEHRRRE